MESRIQTFTYPNGEIQRVHTVTLDSWKKLEYLQPEPAADALDRFAHIYRAFLVPAAPWLFGNLVMFCLPRELEATLPMEDPGCGSLSQPLTAAALVLKAGLRIRDGKPHFRTPQARQLWQQLEEKNCIRLVQGNLPATQVIPVSDQVGYLTQAAPEAALKVNAPFFIMDPFDSATAHDHVGNCIGLCVKDGSVLRPPQFQREALMVRQDGSVSVETPRLEDLTLEVGGRRYRVGVNARAYSRPKATHTPPGSGLRLVIVGDQVVAVKQGGRVAVPSSGFVLCPQGDCAVKAGDPVVYRGMEDVVFGIQVGNSVIRRGQITQGFRSPFYNIRRLEPVAFPPSLYPMDFEKDRAARIVLGADGAGRPMLLWAEGRGKLRYTPGEDSCGASLSELGPICAKVGMKEAVNLDGGGSAQLLLRGVRSLMLADRNEDNTEAQRPVPMSLVVWE